MSFDFFLLSLFSAAFMSALRGRCIDAEEFGSLSDGEPEKGVISKVDRFFWFTDQHFHSFDDLMTNGARERRRD
ncbi:hypothetical protein ASS64_03010 [Erythrobacter sp. AP23]|nr:hypothetical protein ASS64_03010 [Erythrobacter sp. AP23]